MLPTYSQLYIFFSIDGGLTKKYIKLLKNCSQLRYSAYHNELIFSIPRRHIRYCDVAANYWMNRCGRTSSFPHQQQPARLLMRVKMLRSLTQVTWSVWLPIDLAFRLEWDRTDTSNRIVCVRVRGEFSDNVSFVFSVHTHKVPNRENST